MYNTVSMYFIENRLRSVYDMFHENRPDVDKKKQIAVFPLNRPTLIFFCADPAVFIAIYDKIKIFSYRPTLNILRGKEVII